MIRNTLIICAIFFCAHSVKAQYSYGGIDLGYSFMTYKKGSFETEGKFINHQVKANFNYIHRPVRNFAVGLSIGVPVYEKFNWDFSESESIGSSNTFINYSDKENFSTSGGYRASVYDYNIKNGVSKTLIGRLYFDVETNFYVDFRYSFMTVEESFIFRRGGANELRINNVIKHKTRGPGFSVGYHPSLGGNFYFNYQFAMDFYDFDLARSPSFTYDITYHQDSFSGSTNTVSIESPIEDKEIAYLFVMGVTYAF